MRHSYSFHRTQSTHLQNCTLNSADAAASQTVKQKYSTFKVTV